MRILTIVFTLFCLLGTAIAAPAKGDGGPIYETSNVGYTTKVQKGQSTLHPTYSAAPTMVSGATSSPASVHTVAVRPVQTTSSQGLYMPFSNESPVATTPSTIRRVGEFDGENNSGDGEEDGIPSIHPNDTSSLPIGSSAVLVFFALLYAAYLAYRKRLTYTNR